MALKVNCWGTEGSQFLEQQGTSEEPFLYETFTTTYAPVLPFNPTPVLFMESTTSSNVYLLP